jgi:hypothetical protein
MENYCAFSKEHKCIIWMDSELTRRELEKADMLFHGNWIEIRCQNSYCKLFLSKIGFPTQRNLNI